MTLGEIFATLQSSKVVMSVHLINSPVHKSQDVHPLLPLHPLPTEACATFGLLPHKPRRCAAKLGQEPIPANHSQHTGPKTHLIMYGYR